MNIIKKKYLMTKVYFINSNNVITTTNKLIDFLCFSNSPLNYFWFEITYNLQKKFFFFL